MNTRLLKANAVHGLGSKVAFNYDDLRQQCDEYVAQVQEQGRQTIAEARAQAESIRKQAFEEARSAGQQAGLQEAQELIAARSAELAQQKMKEQLQTTLAALQQVVSSLRIERDRWLARWEASAVRLAVTIAEKILRGELDRRPERSGAMIREALQLAAGNPSLTVRMHPRDAAQFGIAGGEIVQSLRPLGAATIIADEQIAPGGCLVETSHGTIDARLETQLERIAAELLDTT